MTLKQLETLRRKASQGESISREEAAGLIKNLSYEAKLQLRELLREMKNAPC